MKATKVLLLLGLAAVALAAPVEEAKKVDEPKEAEKEAEEELPALEIVEEEEKEQKMSKEEKEKYAKETEKMIDACQTFKKEREVCLALEMTKEDLDIETRYDTCLKKLTDGKELAPEDIVTRAKTDRGECWRDLKPVFEACFEPMAAQMQRDELDDYVDRVKTCEPQDQEDN